MAYTYLRPGGAEEVACPDIGVAVNLNGGRREDLVIGWSGGPPPSVDYTLLVLNGGFVPSFGLAETITRPKFMGTADFNGDGRMDVYSVTDEGRGYEPYYSLGDGTLTVGPERFCSDPLELTLRDFNRDDLRDADGRLDVPLATLAGVEIFRQTTAGTLESQAIAPGSRVARNITAAGLTATAATTSAGWTPCRPATTTACWCCATRVSGRTARGSSSPPGRRSPGRTTMVAPIRNRHLPAAPDEGGPGVLSFPSSAVGTRR